MSDLIQRVKIKEPKYYAVRFDQGNEKEFINLMVDRNPFRNQHLTITYNKDKIPTITLGEYTIKHYDWIVIEDDKILEVIDHNTYISKYENVD